MPKVKRTGACEARRKKKLKTDTVAVLDVEDDGTDSCAYEKGESCTSQQVDCITIETDEESCDYDNYDFDDYGGTESEIELHNMMDETAEVEVNSEESDEEPFPSVLVIRTSGNDAGSDSEDAVLSDIKEESADSGDLVDPTSTIIRDCDSRNSMDGVLSDIKEESEDGTDLAALTSHIRGFESRDSPKGVQSDIKEESEDGTELPGPTSSNTDGLTDDIILKKEEEKDDNEGVEMNLVIKKRKNIHTSVTDEIHSNGNVQGETAFIGINNKPRTGPTEFSSGLLQCCFCEYASQSGVELSEHIQAHLPPHICTVCDVKFDLEEAFRSHMEFEHPESENSSKSSRRDSIDLKESGNHSLPCAKYTYSTDKPHSCHMCSHVAKSWRQLATHIAQHVKNTSSAEVIKPVKFFCYHCNFSTYVRYDLVEHMRDHHLTSPPLASQLVCSFKKKTQRLLNHRMKNSHKLEKRYACDVCDYHTKFPQALVGHKKKHRGENTYACDVCDYRTTEISELVLHKRKHAGEELFACDFCDYTTSNLPYMKQHKMAHTGEKPYACDVCDYRTARNSDLFRHKKIHTGEKKYACELCHYKSSRSNQLAKHMMIHSGEKPYACDKCDFRTRSRQSMVNHKLAHAEYRTFLCEDCDFQASTRSGLRYHKYVHKGEKPFVCDMCEYRTAEQKNLLTHKSIHSSDKKPLACDKCDYRAATLACLSYHTIGHSSVRPYACGTCDYRTSNRKLMSQHILGHRRQKPFACTECSFTDICKLKFEQHFSRYHPTVDVTRPELERRPDSKGTATLYYNCPKCLYSGRRKYMLKEHLQERHPEVPVEEYPSTLCESN